MNHVFVCVLVFLATTATDLAGQELAVPARLSLSEAVRLAVERNPQLAAARNQVEIAQAGQVDARLRPNPAFSLMSDNYPLFDPNRPNFLNNQQLSLRVDQDLELAGRRRLRIAAAATGVAASESAWTNERRLLEFEVRRSYFGVVLAQADLEVAEIALAEIDEVIRLNRARYDQGEISGGELRRIQVERLRFVDDRFAALLALRNARSTLLSLLNAPDLSVDFDVTESLATDSAAGPGIDAPTLRAAAVEQRPDLQGAQRAIERASTETQLQRALRTPNVTVGAGYQRNFGADAFIFGFTVPLPFSNRNQGGVARAEAEQRQANNLATAAALTVSLDVQQAINAAEIGRERVSYIEREYLRPSREARDIVLASYRLGSADLIDFLDAQRAFRDTQRTYNRALYDRQLSAFQLIAATGGELTR